MESGSEPRGVGRPSADNGQKDKHVRTVSRCTMLYLKHHVAAGRYAMSMPFRMVLIATLMIMSSGSGAGAGGSTAKRDKKRRNKKKRADRDRYLLRGAYRVSPTYVGVTPGACSHECRWW